MRHTTPRSFWPGVLLGAAAAGTAGILWTGLVSPPAAYAQIPDSGAQRAQMVQELRSANQKLSEITGLLRQVRDNTAAKSDGETKPQPKKG